MVPGIILYISHIFKMHKIFNPHNKPHGKNIILYFYRADALLYPEERVQSGSR